MFTGIVEEVGIVREANLNRLFIQAKNVLEGIKAGDSIAVNGACLTVTSLTSGGFYVDVMPETLRRSNLGQLHYGDKVNLERALKVGSRLGGHLVLGHIDDTGVVESLVPEEVALLARISAPSKLIAYMTEKGFVAVDGVSLTIVGVDSLSFTVSLVAYTLEYTTLGNKRVGDMVNLEADIIAKYVERLLPVRYEQEVEQAGITLDFLKEHGY
jgi:riboflavin synthase